jgi:hypothetical protein
VNSPLFARSPGFLFLTASELPGENILNNSMVGEGPTIIRGTDPSNAPGNVMLTQPVSVVTDLEDKAASWGTSIARTTAGVALGLVLVAFGLFAFYKAVSA